MDLVLLSASFSSLILPSGSGEPGVNRVVSFGSFVFLEGSRAGWAAGRG